jgi:class 3 adenylate cyclase
MENINRLNFTIIGEPVGMATRFETACEPCKIIVGRQTYDEVGADLKNQAVDFIFKRKSRMGSARKNQ